MSKLTELSIKSKKRTTGDGDGLTLIVRPSGAKSWELRYQLNGRRRDMGLGSYPEIGLKEARQKALDARRQAAAGNDPIDAREAATKAAKPLPTFRDIAALVIADAQGKSVNAKVRYQWERHLGPAYSGPLLDRPVHEITTVDVAAVLAPIWRTKPEVARKTYPAIRRVFDRARVILRDEHGVAMGGNPALWSDLKALGFETPKELTRGRHPSLPYDQMANFMSDLRARKAVTARALEFLILTNVRTDAVLKATWDQIDPDDAIWTVPLASLKDRQHRTEGFRVPLSPRAVEIVREMQKARLSRYVFPNMGGGQPLSNMALLTLLKRMNSGAQKWLDKAGRPITAHGFRSSFRTWAEEVATVPHAAVEQAMGHQVGSKVERAYRRTDLLEKRRELMDAWARYCCSGATASNVVTLRSVKPRPERAKDKAPDDPADFAVAVNQLRDYLAGDQTRRFRGNAAPEVRQVAFGLKLIRDLLDKYRESLTIADLTPTGFREALAILDHLRTGQQHPISKHIVGIHSARFRPQRAPVGGIEIEGRKVVVGVTRAYAQVAGVTLNRARTDVADAACAAGVRFTSGMIRQWDDRFKCPDGVAEEDAKADPGPDVWGDLLLRQGYDSPRDVLQNGVRFIACWWAVPELPE